MTVTTPTFSPDALVNGTERRPSHCRLDSFALVPRNARKITLVSPLLRNELLRHAEKVAAL